VIGEEIAYKSFPDHRQGMSSQGESAFPESLPDRPLSVGEARSKLSRWKNVRFAKVLETEEQNGDKLVTYLWVETEILGRMRARWDESAWVVEQRSGSGGLSVRCPKCPSGEYVPVEGEPERLRCTNCTFTFTRTELIELAKQESVED